MVPRRACYNAEALGHWPSGTHCPPLLCPTTPVLTLPSLLQSPGQEPRTCLPPSGRHPDPSLGATVPHQAICCSCLFAINTGRGRNEVPRGPVWVPGVPSLKYRQPHTSMTMRIDDSGHHGAFLCPLACCMRGLRGQRAAHARCKLGSAPMKRPCTSPVSLNMQSGRTA